MNPWREYHGFFIGADGIGFASMPVAILQSANSMQINKVINNF